MIDHDDAALQHYEALIRRRFPPQLAAHLAAARYSHGLGGVPLPTLEQALEVAAIDHPELTRDVGRTKAAIKRMRVAEKGAA